MDNQKLSERLFALAEKATKGPLQIVRYGDGDSLVLHKLNSKTRVCFMATPANDGNMREIKANAALIVELVNNLPTIISALQEKDM